MISKLQYRLIILLITLNAPMFAVETAKTKDQLKEDIVAGGQKAVAAFEEIIPQKRYDLFPVISELIKKEKDFKIIYSALELYEKIIDLEKIYSGWKDDVDWIIKNKSEQNLIFKSLDLIELKKEHSLIYLPLKFQNSENGLIRRKSFKVIATLRDDRAIPYLMQLANSSRPIYKYYFLEAIGYYRDERFDSFLFNMITEESPGVRSKALQTIVKLNLQNKFFIIPQKALEDPNYDVRKHSINIIKKNNLKQYSYVLSKSIFDSNYEVRNATVNAIVKFKEKNYAKFIAEQLKKENVDPLKLKMIDALVNLNNHGGGQGLVAVLDDNNEKVRSKSVHAISLLGLNSASKNIIEVFKNEKNHTVKMDFIKAMGILKDSDFSLSLIQILNSPQEKIDLKKLAIISINQIDDDKILLELFTVYEAEKQVELKSMMSDVIKQLLKRHHAPGK